MPELRSPLPRKLIQRVVSFNHQLFVYCNKRHLPTTVNSELCMVAQTENIGCHACGRLACYTGDPKCHALCSRHHHVCDSAPDGGGCESCGLTCHATNADRRCAFFNRGREDIWWSADAQQLLDTQAGTQGMLPHMTQITWNFLDVRMTELMVDGIVFRRGYGNPGHCNNCLIDSLRQCLGDLQCNCGDVRTVLLERFSKSPGRALVTPDSYLDVEHHWETIVQSLLHLSGNPDIFDRNNYCLVALYGTNEGNGVVLGNPHAACRLVIINWNDVHFDPCLPQ